MQGSLNHEQLFPHDKFRPCKNVDYVSLHIGEHVLELPQQAAQEIFAPRKNHTPASPFCQRSIITDRFAANHPDKLARLSGDPFPVALHQFIVSRHYSGGLSSERCSRILDKYNSCIISKQIPNTDLGVRYWLFAPANLENGEEVVTSDEFPYEMLPKSEWLHVFTSVENYVVGLIRKGEAAS